MSQFLQHNANNTLYIQLDLHILDGIYPPLDALFNLIEIRKRHLTLRSNYHGRLLNIRRKQNAYALDLTMVYYTKLDIPIIFSMDLYDLYNLYKDQTEETVTGSTSVQKKESFLADSLGK